MSTSSNKTHIEAHIKTQLTNHVAQFLAHHNALKSPIAVALSGGMDSVVLLDILFQLKALPPTEGIQPNASPSLDLQAIHVNHHLSPNAQQWADFCVAECAKRAIPIIIENVTVDRNSGMGLEAAARDARYAALKKSAARFILTAQHQDDQAETVLHQMLRGTGLNGLAGMGEARALHRQAQTQTLLRPILKITRAEIETYAKSQSLNWIEDESNQDTTYTRNFIRHEVAPIVAARFPHYAQSLSRAAQHAAESATLNEALAKIDLRWDDQSPTPEAHADALDSLPFARQTNALYYWLHWHNITPPSRAQLETWAVQLFREAPIGKPHQAGGHDFLIVRKRGKLALVV